MDNRAAPPIYHLRKKKHAHIFFFFFLNFRSFPAGSESPLFFLSLFLKQQNDWKCEILRRRRERKKANAGQSGLGSGLSNFSRCLLPHFFSLLFLGITLTKAFRTLSLSLSPSLLHIHTAGVTDTDKMAEWLRRSCVLLYVWANQPALTCVNTALALSPQMGTLSRRQRRFEGWGKNQHCFWHHK